MKKIDVKDMEPIFKGLIEVVGVDGLATLMNNVFYHGTILDEMYGASNDKDLARLYKAIELIGRVGEKLNRY